MRIFEEAEKYLSPSDFVVPLYRQVAEMLFAQRKEGEVNPARLLNVFTDSEEQREAKKELEDLGRNGHKLHISFE